MTPDQPAVRAAYERAVDKEKRLVAEAANRLRRYGQGDCDVYRSQLEPHNTDHDRLERDRILLAAAYLGHLDSLASVAPAPATPAAGERCKHCNGGITHRFLSGRPAKLCRICRGTGIHQPDEDSTVTTTPASPAAGERFDAAAFVKECLFGGMGLMEAYKDQPGFNVALDGCVKRFATRLNARLAALERERDGLREALAGLIRGFDNNDVRERGALQKARAALAEGGAK